jgi:exopolyphosphatase/guanosine-5'-triphosphate,3'-diphosphate pyrophosphatase
MTHPPDPESFPILAALDLGTNNCRLLVARPAVFPSRADHGIRVLDTFSRIVRLGEGLQEGGNLGAEAMARTLGALKSCKRKLDKFQVRYGRFVATEACRIADNTGFFLDRVAEECGIEIEVISSEEEAKLAFLGCSSLLEPHSEYALVFDIGGGSTEFMWARRDRAASPEMLCEHRILDWLSLKLGVMNLSDAFGGPLYAESYFREIVETLKSKLAVFSARNRVTEEIGRDRLQILSTSGTMTTLAAVQMGLTHYERSRIDGFSFRMDELHEATQRILAMRPSERFDNPCIGADRSDYIVSGCAIFQAVYELWPAREITIADRGVREGIILSLMQRYLREQIA